MFTVYRDDLFGDLYPSGAVSLPCKLDSVIGWDTIPCTPVSSSQGKITPGDMISDEVPESQRCRPELYHWRSRSSRSSSLGADADHHRPELLRRGLGNHVPIDGAICVFEIHCHLRDVMERNCLGYGTRDRSASRIWIYTTSGTGVNGYTVHVLSLEYSIGVPTPQSPKELIAEHRKAKESAKGKDGRSSARVAASAERFYECDCPRHQGALHLSTFQMFCVPTPDFDGKEQYCFDCYAKENGYMERNTNTELCSGTEKLVRSSCHKEFVRRLC
jgi:hypothetical protein